MSFENRHIFKGKINGIKLSDFREGLDYKKTKLEDRKNIVEKLIEEKGMFFEEYFDNHYKAELNQNDELAENNNVCATLEMMADYLLGADEVRSERKNKQEYRFYRDKTEFKLRTKKEESLNGKLQFASSKVDTDKADNDERVIDFLLKSGENSKKSKAQKIFKKDLEEDSYCGEVLREYQCFIDDIERKLKDIKINKNNSPYKGKRYLLTKAKKDLHYDMIYCKTHLRGTFGEKLKCPLQESTCPDWDKFDWHEKSHIKALLFMQCEYEPQEDLAYMILDLEHIIKELKKEVYNNELKKISFTNNEVIVVDYVRRGYSITEIKNIMRVSQQRVSQIVDNIVMKIQEYTLDNFKREA